MKTDELTNYGKRSLHHALMAIVWEVIAGVLSLFLDISFVGWIALAFSVSALINGIKSLRVGETESRGSAIAGLVISSILILIRIILLILLFIAFFI